MKISADQGGCYPPRPSVCVDNTLLDQENSLYPTKAKLKNYCFIIHSKYFPVLKGVLPFQFLFFRSPKVTQSRPQVFSVNGSIICCRLHFWRHFDVISLIICSWLHFWHHWFNMTKILFKLNGQQQLARVNYMYVCGFNQLEMGKYFWMNNN